MSDRKPIPHPPADPTALPRLIARVAVTGHRPASDPDSTDPKVTEGSRAIVKHELGIRDSIRAILKEVVAITGYIGPTAEGAYSPEPPVLRILSSLAEGADRMVVQEALAMRPKHHVKLECPLPAAREKYRDDFITDASKAEFQNLLDEASAVFELDGQREGQWLRASDYASAGHIAVSNCDLLIAIWDGSIGKEGGTGAIVEEAKRDHVPMLRIDVTNPQSITMYMGRGGWTTDWRNELKRILLLALQPPLPPPPPKKHSHDKAHSTEKVQSGAEWLSGYASERIPVGVPDSERSDELATRYGNRYRWSFRLKYGLAALAVFFAVSGLIFESRDEWIWPGMEFLSIAGILTCFALASKDRWHERWLDYRLLAEQFRVLGFLRPLGETVPVFHPPKYWEAPPPRHSCVRWYFRARLRECSLPHLRVGKEYVRRQKSNVQIETEKQWDYHTGKHKWEEWGSQVTEWAGVALFAITAAACIAHLVGWGPRLSLLILGGLTAWLPALGAAMEGLQAQEEGKRLAGRAEAMRKHLVDVEDRLNKLPHDPDLASVAAIAFDLATEMTWETSGWHNLILGQPPRI
jgi:hypothetical protein